jgi:hypothetical protein
VTQSGVIGSYGITFVDLRSVASIWPVTARVLELAFWVGSGSLLALASYLGRVLINRQPNADLDVAPTVRYWG